jgi:hypothetical protein
MRRVVERLPWVLLGLAVIAYFLPWAWHPVAGLSPGAYDLAEWASLHPTARASTPSLLPSFWLRAELGLLAGLVAAQTTHLKGGPSRWVTRALALGLALTLFPPLEFFTVAGEDANYQQQFMLGLGSLALVIFAIWTGRLSHRARHIFATCLGLMGIGAGLSGLSQGLSILESLGLSPVMGAGSVLLTICLALLVATYAYHMLREVQGV